MFKEKEGVVHDSLISSELSFFLSFSFYFDVATLEESDFSRVYLYFLKRSDFNWMEF